MKHEDTDARLPVVTVGAAHIGPLGLGLGDDGEPGGGTEPAGAFMPVFELKYLDDRETCERVHDFVFFEKTPADLTSCPAFVGPSGHHCRRVGQGTPCAFLEGSDAAIWAKARDWKRTFYRGDDGGLKVMYLYDPDDRHPEGAPMGEAEGEVEP